MKSRFTFVITISVLLLLSMSSVLAAEVGDGPTREAADTSPYQEAPMLATQVEAGNLPPVDERLPDDIQIVTPTDGLGQYGGTWHATTWWGGAGNIKMILYEPPIRWKPDYSGYEPGLLTQMPVWSADGQTITFTFRSGLKWSDGEPFTTDDLEFWWNDLALNNNYDAAYVPWWATNSDGSPTTMRFPDAETWVLEFNTARYLVPYTIAQGFWEWDPLMKPAHFLKQWHPDYSDETTYAALEAHDNWFETPGYPCLMAWCLKDYKPGESWLFERNPYYWKVDPQGKQLPYIDYLQVDLETDATARAQRAVRGGYDCTFRGLSDTSQRALLLANASSGDYELLSGWTNGAGAWPGFMVNQDYHTALDYDPNSEPEIDKEIRALLRNKSFRQGLSHALNRQQVLDEVWNGEGETKQFTISPQSPHFEGAEGQAVYEAWANSYVTYSTSTATSLWNSIGFTDSNGDGWRELPSGDPFTLTIDLNDWGGEEINTAATDVFSENLRALGVHVSINDVIGTEEGRIRSNYGLYMIRTAHAAELELWTYPDWVFPLRGGGEGARAFPMQGLWYQSGGTAGWEPEPNSPAERLQDLYDQGRQTRDPQTREELIWDAIDIHINDGPFVIGATGDQPEMVVCKTYFNNVQEDGVLGPWAPGSPGNVHPEQFWMGDEVVITPGVSTTLAVTDTQGTAITMEIPETSTTEPVTLVHTPVTTLTQQTPVGPLFTGLAFDLNAYRGTELQTGFQFNTPITFTVTYSDSLVSGLTESSLTLNYWDEDDQAWKDVATSCNPASTYTRMPAENRLSVSICHLSRFGMFAKQYVYLPLVLRQP